MKNRLQTLLIPVFFFLLTPFLQAQEFGIASIYEDKFDGKKTAHDLIYNKDQMVASHKRYPAGTILRVTRLDVKKSITVRVIDKGPFVKGYIVDLSRAAANALGMTGKDVAEVKVEVVKRMEGPAITEVPKPPVTVPADPPADYDEPTPDRIDTRPDPVITEKEKEEKKQPLVTREVPPKKEAAKPETKAPEKTPKAKAVLVRQDFKQYGLYKIQLEKPTQSGYGVQVASLSNYDNVLKHVADLQAKWFDNILVSVEKGSDGNSVYKILLGTFETEEKAIGYKNSLKKKYKINGFVVNMQEIQY